MKKQIFGETDGIRVKVGATPLRPGEPTILAKAARKNGFDKRKILFGRDTRLSGRWIVEDLKAAFDEADVVDCGVLPTPAIAKIMDDYENAGAFMVTASHNPATDNGIKVFEKGTKIPDETELAIERDFLKDQPKDVDEKAVEREIETLNAKSKKFDSDAALMENYAQKAADALGRATFRGTGRKIVLDSASGAGFEFSRGVFERFDIEVEQIDDAPTGLNINEDCGALHPEHLAQKTKELNLMGLALDGDADRCVLADEEGRIWNGDRIVVLLAEYLKEKGELAGNGVVLTEYSNLATVQYLESKGIRVLKVVNGDKAVSDLCKKEGFTLGGEAAGHILYQPWLDSSDGTFMALFVMGILQEKQARLADLWSDYNDKPSIQVPVMVTEKRPIEEIAGFPEAIAAIEQKMAGDGRVFVRYSGTENKMRILIEYTEAKQAQEWGEELAAIVRKELE